MAAIGKETANIAALESAIEKSVGEISTDEADLKAYTEISKKDEFSKFGAVYYVININNEKKGTKHRALGHSTSYK